MPLFAPLRRITLKGLLYRAAEVIERRERMQLAAKVMRRTGTTVSSGPFVGMRCCPDVAPDVWVPMVMGSFECELHPTLERLLAAPFATIVNIGCAEGYYAVGLAMRCPRAQIIAYDIDPAARENCVELAALNGVEGRVAIRGECTAHALSELPGQGVLIVCDCEGAEVDILDPAVAFQLRSATMLVELHDAVRAECTRTMLERFDASHDIEFIVARTRDVSHYHALGGLSRRQKLVVLDERRLGQQQWAILEPKNGSLLRPATQILPEQPWNE